MSNMSDSGICSPMHQSEPWYRRRRSRAVDGRLMALTVELIEGNVLSVKFPGGF